MSTAGTYTSGMLWQGFGVWRDLSSTVQTIVNANLYAGLGRLLWSHKLCRKKKWTSRCFWILVLTRLYHRPCGKLIYFAPAIQPRSSLLGISSPYRIFLSRIMFPHINSSRLMSKVWTLRVLCFQNLALQQELLPLFFQHQPFPWPWTCEFFWAWEVQRGCMTLLLTDSTDLSHLPIPRLARYCTRKSMKPSSHDHLLSP